MKTITLYSLGLLLSVVLTTSCKKKNTSPEEPVTSSPANNPATVEAMLNGLAAPLQTYTLNADSVSEATCTNGIIIRSYQTSFVTQAGQPVHGMVNIEVKEILSKKDMILNNAFPVSNMFLLVSGGGLYINATQNGENLKINPASIVHYFFPTGTAGPFTQVRNFYAVGPPNLSVTNLNWLPNTTTLPLDITKKNGNYYYMLWSKSLGWQACDYYYPAGQRTTCTVNLKGDFNNSNTLVYISKNNEPVATRFFSHDGGTSQQFQSSQITIPVGEEYVIGAIGYDGKNYYSAFQQLTMTENTVIDMPDLLKTTKSQIEINLAGLP